MADMHCTACHQYLAEEEKLLPLRKGCLDGHQALTKLGITWPANAPMQYPCGDCHRPHEQTEPLVGCLSCHAVEGTHLEEAHRASPCQRCHQAHEWQVNQRETCLTCHSAQADDHPPLPHAAIATNSIRCRYCVLVCGDRRISGLTHSKNKKLEQSSS